jgi:hypothetical protein
MYNSVTNECCRKTFIVLFYDHKCGILLAYVVRSQTENHKADANRSSGFQLVLAFHLFLRNVKPIGEASLFLRKRETEPQDNHDRLYSSSW